MHPGSPSPTRAPSYSPGTIKVYCQITRAQHRSLLTHSLPTRCAFSNPSSPYGLTRLPLAPEEDRVVKARDKTTPQIVAKVTFHTVLYCSYSCHSLGFQLQCSSGYPKVVDVYSFIGFVSSASRRT